MNQLSILLLLFFLFQCTNLYCQDNSLAQKQPLQVQFRYFGVKYYQGNKSIDKEAFVNKMKTNDLAYDEFRLGKKLNTTSNIVGIPAALIVGFELGKWLGSGEKPEGSLLTASGITWGAAMAIGIIGRKKIKGAVDIYNSSEKIGFKFNIGEDGVGLVFQF